MTLSKMGKKNHQRSLSVFYLGIVIGILLSMPVAFWSLERYVPEWLADTVFTITNRETVNAKQTSESIKNALTVEINKQQLNHARATARLLYGVKRYQAVLAEGSQTPVYFAGAVHDNLPAFKAALQKLYQDKKFIHSRQEKLRHALAVCSEDHKNCRIPELPVVIEIAAQEFDQFLVQSDSSAYIDWASGWIYAFGETAQTSKDDRIAREIAAAQLHKTASALLVNSHSTLADVISRKPYLQQQISDWLKHAEIIERQLSNIGGYQIIIRASLLHDNGLIASLIPIELERISRQLKSSLYEPVASFDSKYSSIIIDARGLRLKPGLFARIYNRSGQVLYDLTSVDPNILLLRGLVIYSQSFDALRIDLRLGDEPLLIAAFDAAGKNRVDLVVEDIYSDELSAVNINNANQIPIAILID